MYNETFVHIYLREDWLNIHVPVAYRQLDHSELVIPKDFS